jgi:hypothetical protein
MEDGLKELQIADSLDEAVAALEREVAGQAASDELLTEWLLPKYSLALRRMRAAGAGKTDHHQAAFDLFSVGHASDADARSPIEGGASLARAA